MSRVIGGACGRSERASRMVRAAIVLGVCLASGPRATAQGYVCAEGGGGVAAGEWSTPILRWMVSKARPDGGARVIVLGSRDPGAEVEAAGGDADRICERFLAAGAVQAESLWINSDNAADPAVSEAIRGADVVWIRGGAQSRYCKYWKDTPVEDAIRAVFARGGAVGGTSAGCAVMGEISYDALGGSCAPLDALRDGQAREISFTTGFLDLVPGVLFDTHFGERGRLARLVVMLGRCRTDFGEDVLGIGVDTRTALCISPDGTAEVMGQGAAAVLRLAPSSRIDVAAGHAPTVTDVSLMQLLAGQKLDVKTGRVLEEEESAVGDHGEPRGPGPIPRAFEVVDIDGGDLGGSSLGSFRLVDGGGQEALWRGELGVEPGQGALSGAIAHCRTFDDRGFVENRLGGMLYGAARNPGVVGIWLSSGNGLHAAGDRLTIKLVGAADAGPRAPSAIVIESAGMWGVEHGRERTAAENPGPRQVVGFRGCWVHVLPPGWTYDARSRAVLPPSGAEP